MSRRRRSIAVVAVLLAAALAAWWWLAPEDEPDGGPVEAGGADVAPAGTPRAEPRETRRALERVEVVSTPAGTGAGEQRSTFSGRVTSQDTGAPIPGATVTFFLDGAHDVLADAGGAFRFQAPRPGTYELRRIAAAGFVPYDSEQGAGHLRFVARPGVSVGGIQLELRPLRLCRGTVTRGGHPVAGARVRCGRREHVVGEALTAGDGTFELGCDSTVVLSVVGERARRWFEGNGECRWEVDLERDARSVEGDPSRRSRTLTGRVVDERSRPVGGVIVWCLGADADPANEAVARRMRAWGGSRVDRTDEDGAFECQVSASDESRVLVPGVPSSEQRVSATADRVTLVIPVRGGLRGSVRDVDDRPVPAFGIALQPAAAGAGYERAFISADGTFEIEDIVANRYEVVAARPGFPPSPPATVDIRPGATAEVTLILRKGLTVRGTVLDAVTRRPISGARISAPRLGRLPGPVADPEVFVTADAYGRFEISRVLLEGASSLTVSAPGYNDWVLGIREAELEEVTVELTPAAVDAGTEFGGVGMGMNGQLFVTLVHPAGPAARAGIVVGDRITRIDGRTPEDLEDAISRIRGPLGTQVEIQLRRADGGVLDTRLRRERIAAVP